MPYDYERQGTGYDSGARGYELQGRRRRPVMEVPETEIQAGMQALRNILEVTGYSSFVSDQQCREITIKILEAALAVRAG